MKKIVMIGMIVILLFALTGLASATPKLVPEGTVASADVSGATATIAIRGVDIVDVELYNHEGVKHLGAVNTFTINLREGRRFNFKFKSSDGEYYALITPDMIGCPQDFLGPGVALDCNNPNGCCFVIMTKKK